MSIFFVGCRVLLSWFITGRLTERGLFVENTEVKRAVIWTVTWELDLSRVLYLQCAEHQIFCNSYALFVKERKLQPFGSTH
jgi:hypothetical protein